MKWDSAPFALALFLVSHFTSSSIAAGTYNWVAAASTRRRYIQEKGLHPTLQKYSDLSALGYKHGYKEEKTKVLATDPILQHIAKSSTTPEEYSAAFRQFRPPRDDANPMMVGGLNHMVNAMMTAHMKHLGKPKDFQLFAKGLTARLGREDREGHKASRRTEMLSEQGHIVKERSKDRKTQAKNARIFRSDMMKYGIEVSDDPVNFEENTRPLIDVHGKLKASRKLRDFLDLTSKNDDFNRKVEDLRQLHMHQRYVEARPQVVERRRKKQRLNDTAARGLSSSSMQSTPPSSIQPSPRQSTPPRPFSPLRRPLPSTPPSPQVWNMRILQHHTPPPSPSFADAINAKSHPQSHHSPSLEAALHDAEPEQSNVSDKDSMGGDDWLRWLMEQ